MSMKQKIEIAVQAANSLKYLHEQDIVHNDIKPKNIVYRIADHHKENRRYVAKLTDFGQSEEICGGSEDRRLGTAGWIAPEYILERLKITGAHGKKGIMRNGLNKKMSDIWSLGCTIYFTVHGTHPMEEFSPESISEYKEYIHKLNKKKEYLEASTLEIDRLIAIIMIQEDPNKRPDIGGTVCALSNMSAEVDQWG